MYYWGIIPYCETSHEGIMKVFYKLGEVFQMFVVDEDATNVRTLSNWNKRRIHLCVDGLLLNGKKTDDKDGDEYDFGCGDEDDDAVSVVSSCMGDRSFDRTSTATDNDGPAGNDDVDDKQRDEIVQDENSSESLKKLGNVKRKEMSKFILKDLLGSDGEIAVRGIKSKHLKQLKREQMQINQVYHTV